MLSSRAIDDDSHIYVTNTAFQWVYYMCGQEMGATLMYLPQEWK